MASIRYIVTDVESSVVVYRDKLEFKVDRRIVRHGFAHNLGKEKGRLQERYTRLARAARFSD